MIFSRCFCIILLVLWRFGFFISFNHPKIFSGFRTKEFHFFFLSPLIISSFRWSSYRASSRLRCLWILWSSVILRNVISMYFYNNNNKKAEHVSLLFDTSWKILFIWYWYSPQESFYLLSLKTILLTVFSLWHNVCWGSVCWGGW